MAQSNSIYNARLKDVAIAITELVSINVVPTKRKVLKKIGGSFSSPWINRGYNELRDLTNNFTNLAPLYTNYNIDKSDHKTVNLADENIDLKAKIESLESYVQKLESDHANLTQKNIILTKENDVFQKALDLIKTERETILTEVKSDKDLQIRALMAELAKTHNHYQDEITKVATKHDDAVIMTKVEIVNLKDKVSAQAKKIRAQDGELLTLRMKLQKLTGQKA